MLSIGAGALLGLHRDVSPLTGALALVAGGASGLVAIARELGGDDRVVAVVQYLRVASDHLVDARRRHARLSRRKRPDTRAAPVQSGSAPWYLSVAMLVVIVLVGATGGRAGPIARRRAARPDGASPSCCELTGLSFGLSVPMVLVQVGYAVIGWQAGVAFTRQCVAARSAGRCLPRSA